MSASQNRKRVAYFLKLGLGIGLILVLVRGGDLARYAELFQDIRWPWVALALGISLTLRVLMSWRWQVVLLSQGMEVSLAELFRITLIGVFIGQFIPGGMGPDIVRGYELVSRRGQTVDVTSTLILDRFIGVYSMLFVAFVGAVIARASGVLEGFALPLLGVQILVVGGWVLARYAVGPIRKLSLFEKGAPARWWDGLLRVIESITDLERLWRVFPRIFAVSIMVQIFRCVMFFALFRALGEPVRLLDCVTLIPLVFVVILLPVSIGGLGLREGALVYLFGIVGVADEVSVSAGILSHLVLLIVSMLGLYFWIFKSHGKLSGTHEKAGGPLEF